MATALPLLEPAPPAANGGDTRTLIVSDLHLGLPSSRPLDVLALLESWRFERLILLGDIFHDFRFRHISPETWRLLRHIRTLGHEQQAELLWLKGNHDRPLAGIVHSLTGIRMRESFRWTCAGRRYLAVHGDRFDRFISLNRRTSQRLSDLYAFCQRRLSREGRWPQLLDRMHGRFSDLGEQVAQRAARYAGRRAIDVIVCGHTHMPLHRRFPRPAGAGHEAGAIDYLNTGAWIDRPATFVTVDDDGAVIRRWP